MIFEWDPAKAARNKGAHGITFEEASSVFSDPLAGIIEDPRHSFDEQRLVLIGILNRNKLIAIMFAERGERIRIISARRATRSERKAYEENQL